MWFCVFPYVFFSIRLLSCSSVMCYIIVLVCQKMTRKSSHNSFSRQLPLRLTTISTFICYCNCTNILTAVLAHLFRSVFPLFLFLLCVHYWRLFARWKIWITTLWSISSCYQHTRFVLFYILFFFHFHRVSVFLGATFTRALSLKRQRCREIERKRTCKFWLFGYQFKIYVMLVSRLFALIYLLICFFLANQVTRAVARPYES